MTDDRPELDPAALALALAQLRAGGDHDAADALLAHLKGGGGVAKAMSSLSMADGGALVPPASTMRRRKKRLRACIKKALDRLGGVNGPDV